MSPRAKIKQVLDFGRLANALSRPGIDPRSWVAYGRIEDDPDAIRWEEGTGWIVDVTINSGELAGENLIPCRVMTTFGGLDRGRIEPALRGAEVVILLVDGDPNAMPVVAGYVYNPEDGGVPDTVNGDVIDESLALANHILVTPHSVKEQIGGSIEVRAEGSIEYASNQNATFSASSTAYLLGALVRLAEENASQPFVRGTAFASAFSAMLGALSIETASASAVASALVAASQVLPPGPYPNPTMLAAALAWQASLAALAAQITTLQTRIATPGDILSTRISGT